MTVLGFDMFLLLLILDLGNGPFHSTCCLNNFNNLSSPNSSCYPLIFTNNGIFHVLLSLLVCSTTYGASEINEEYIVGSYWILNLMKPNKKNLKVNVNKCFQRWCFQGKLVFLDVVCVAVLNLQNKIIAISFTAKRLKRTNWWCNNVLVIVQIFYTRGRCCLILFQLASICPDFNVLTQLSCCKRWWL